MRHGCLFPKLLATAVRAPMPAIGSVTRSPSKAGRPSRTPPFSVAEDRLPWRQLAGTVIPQAHPTGYPLYRLEWQALGSLQRRLRNCLVGMRAEPYEYGAPEMVDLELYLMWRARGMTLESPAVRP